MEVRHSVTSAYRAVRGVSSELMTSRGGQREAELQDHQQEEMEAGLDLPTPNADDTGFWWTRFCLPSREADPAMAEEWLSLSHPGGSAALRGILNGCCSFVCLSMLGCFKR